MRFRAPARARPALGARAEFSGSRPSASAPAIRAGDARLRALALEGVPVVHGDGAIPDASWPAERSVLAIGIERAGALQLAERFGQNAWVEVVAGEPARLVFTRHWGE